LAQRDDFELVLVVGSNATRTKIYLANYRLEGGFAAIADSDRGLTEQYKVAAVPYAVVVDEGGHVGAKGSVLTLEEIESLVHDAEEWRQQRHETQRQAAPPAVPAGAPDADREPATA
jgi:hypothetical protein